MVNVVDRDNSLVTGEAPGIPFKGKERRRWRQLWAVFLIPLVLAACGSNAPPKGSIDFVQTYFGGLAADEPKAALVARDTLSAGGNAVDAAVAMYFALSVTLPSSAGLGGGGVCTLFNNQANTASSLDFTVAAPSQPVPPGRWPVAVPGAVRGMAALHARYGSLRWEQVVLPAELLARFGTPISRALRVDIARGADRLRADPASWRVFGGVDGKGLREGDPLRQFALAGVLAQIRQGGAGKFYIGTLAKDIVGGVQEMGGWMTIEDLRGYRPKWRSTVTAKFGNHVIHFPPAPITGGQIAKAMWSALGPGGRFGAAAEADKAVVVAAAAGRSYAALGLRPTGDYGTAGFVVMDRAGDAVACSLGMNGLFGTARMIRGTGIIAAFSPRPDWNDVVAMSPVVITNPYTGLVYLAAVGSGGAAAPAALVSVLLGALKDELPLEKALNRARMHPAPSPGAMRVEPHMDAAARAAVAGRGLGFIEVPAIGRVNIMYCPESMARSPRLCDVRADPRSHGYAINAEF